MFFSDNTGFSSVPSTSSCSNNRPASSLSSGSMSGDSGFATSSLGGVGGGFFTPPYPFHYSRTTFSSGSSANTSVGSSPTPNDQDLSQILQQTAAMLAFGNQPDRVPGNVGADLAGCPLTTFGSCMQELLHGNTANPLCSLTDNAAFKNRAHQNHLNAKAIHRPLPPISGRKSPKADSYKTVMCQAWLETNKCNFAENCRFAHGEEELRPSKTPIKNPKYKTKLCDKYTMTGLCPYGNRCLFIHPDANARNAYIRPDRLAKMERERNAQALSSDKSTYPQTPLSSHVSARPPPSWPLESANFFSSHREEAPLINTQTSTPSIGAAIRASFSETPILSTPSSCEFGLSPDVPEFRSFALGDITNRGSSPVVSASTPATSSIKLESPESGVESDEGLSTGWSTMDSDPFHLAIASDNLARHLATGFTTDWRLP